MGMGFAIYSYLGYYNVCYLGGEVRDPDPRHSRSRILIASRRDRPLRAGATGVTGVVCAEAARKRKSNLTGPVHARRAWPVGRVACPPSASWELLRVGVFGAARLSRQLPNCRGPRGALLRWVSAVDLTDPSRSARSDSSGRWCSSGALRPRHRHQGPHRDPHPRTVHRPGLRGGAATESPARSTTTLADMCLYPLPPRWHSSAGSSSDVQLGGLFIASARATLWRASCVFSSGRSIARRVADGERET